VAVNDLHDDRASAVAAGISDAGGRAIAVACDITDADAVREALSRVEDELGPVDILVNNAGVVPGSSTPKTFTETTPADWSAQIELNMVASMRLIHAVLPGQIDRGWGRIIQISSGAASQGLRVGVAPYAAAKAGIESLIRHVAVEAGSHGVTANALALGLMENVGAADAPQLQGMIAAVPVRRLGQPEEIGGAAVWLSSSFGGFVTGQVIHLNGGTVFGR
jgi:NAD(P)-dependent dehydrogenase (short-subunit alcohol dehydrogenase family)